MLMTSKQNKAVLVVAHDLQTRQWLSTWLHNNGFDPIATDDIDTARNNLDRDPMLVISDIDSPQTSVNRLTQVLRSSEINAPVIVLANESSANQAVESMGDGATDYLLKPINTTELSAKLNRAINERKLTEEVIALQQEKRNCQQSSTGSDEVKTLQSLERDAILKALDRFNGVRGKTAKALGISVRTLQRKIKEYGYNGNK